MKRPGREISPVHSARAALGPSAQQLTASPPNKPGTAPLLGQIWPSHLRVAPSPSDLNPTAARARRANKTGDGGDPGTLAFILSLPVFSLHEMEATAAGHGGRAEWAGRRHRGLLAGARSPVGERAAIELAMDGASLSSPRACVPASRRRAAEHPVPRPDEAGCAGLSRTRAAMGDA